MLFALPHFSTYLTDELYIITYDNTGGMRGMVVYTSRREAEKVCVDLKKRDGKGYSVQTLGDYMHPEAF